jgi:hypothetical protein
MQSRPTTVQANNATKTPRDLAISRGSFSAQRDAYRKRDQSIPEQVGYLYNP